MRPYKRTEYNEVKAECFEESKNKNNEKLFGFLLDCRTIFLCLPRILSKIYEPLLSRILQQICLLSL